MVPYIEDEILSEYLFWNLKGRYFAIRDITGQDKRRGLNMSLVGQLTVPLPPLAEQKRIVIKIKEIMALIEDLRRALSSKEVGEISKFKSSRLKPRNKILSKSGIHQKATPSPVKIFPIQQAIGIVFQRGFERGEMPVAKVLYLAQEVYGVPLAIPFTPQTFGPYDTSVKKALTAGLSRYNNFFKKRGYAYYKNG
jgi:hypothetical protein